MAELRGHLPDMCTAWAGWWGSGTVGWGTLVRRQVGHGASGSAALFAALEASLVQPPPQAPAVAMQQAALLCSVQQTANGRQH